MRQLVSLHEWIGCHGPTAAAEEGVADEFGALELPRVATQVTAALQPR